ncbi:phage tail protein [Nocardia flavorosea]|uniref:phage tail protein n=1 Tax=Nocardia flavorosea TaxID=53429 RepID=UPI002B4B09B2|nr:phage tail protein [Nocardia flavorosea]
MNLLLRNRSTKIVVWDIHGRVWHLHGCGAGREGVRLDTQSGYMFAPVNLLVSEGARQDGATFLRSVRNKKEIDFFVFIDGRGDVRSFHAIHDAWHRGWSTDIPCKMGYFTRHQGWRYQMVQLDSAPELQGSIDPTRNAAVEYQMSVTAMDPLERHLGEHDVWINSDGANEGIVVARNAADQPAWPRYTMPGPGRYAIQDPLGDDLRIVETPLLVDGEELRIDTHPRHRTARVYSEALPEGRNVWGQMGGRRWFASLPPWSSTEIIVRVTDGDLESGVRVDVAPRSSRPF